MKTRVITVNSNGEGIGEALRQTELVAQSYDLSNKETLQLRLLAEEMRTPPLLSCTAAKPMRFASASRYRSISVKKPVVLPIAISSRSVCFNCFIRASVR